MNRFFRPLVFITLLILLVIGISNTVYAQNQGQLVCGKHDEMVDILNVKHKEFLEAISKTSTGALLEIYVNHESTTWSIIVTTYNNTGQKKTCIVSTGDNYYRNFSTKSNKDSDNSL